MSNQDKQLMYIDPQLVEIICKVNSVFKNYDKTAAWMNTPNLNFGGCTPTRLINVMRGSKVLVYVNNAINENKHGVVM